AGGARGFAPRDGLGAKLPDSGMGRRDGENLPQPDAEYVPQSGGWARSAIGAARPRNRDGLDRMGQAVPLSRTEPEGGRGRVRHADREARRVFGPRRFVVY